MEAKDTEKEISSRSRSSDRSIRGVPDGRLCDLTCSFPGFPASCCPDAAGTSALPAPLARTVSQVSTVLYVLWASVRSFPMYLTKPTTTTSFFFCSETLSGSRIKRKADDPRAVAPETKSTSVTTIIQQTRPNYLPFPRYHKPGRHCAGLRASKGREEGPGPRSPWAVPGRNSGLGAASLHSARVAWVLPNTVPSCAQGPDKPPRRQHGDRQS